METVGMTGSTNELDKALLRGYLGPRARRLQETISTAAGGSFLIAHRALRIEQRKAGYGKSLRLSDVLCTIHQLQSDAPPENAEV
jgi:hypothetical protein